MGDHVQKGGYVWGAHRGHSPAAPISEPIQRHVQPTEPPLVGPPSMKQASFFLRALPTLPDAHALAPHCDGAHAPGGCFSQRHFLRRSPSHHRRGRIESSQTDEYPAARDRVHAPKICDPFRRPAVRWCCFRPFLVQPGHVVGLEVVPNRRADFRPATARMVLCRGDIYTCQRPPLRTSCCYTNAGIRPRDIPTVSSSLCGRQMQGKGCSRRKSHQTNPRELPLAA